MRVERPRPRQFGFIGLGGRSAAKGSGAASLEYSFVCFEWVAGFVWTELYFLGVGFGGRGKREDSVRSRGYCLPDAGRFLGRKVVSPLFSLIIWGERA
jgi:hypothetical protein